MLIIAANNMNTHTCKTTVLGSGKTIGLCVNPECKNQPLYPTCELRIKRTRIPFVPPLKQEDELANLKSALQYNYDMLENCTKHYNMKIAEYKKKIAEIEN